MLIQHRYVPDDYYSDNQSLVKTLNKKTPLSPLSPDWDLTEPTRAFVCENDITCKHVKGHQDDRSSELDLIAEANVRADKLADFGRT